MNDPMFQPPWAADALGKPSETEMQELALLRAFYEAWIAYHSAPKKDKAKLTAAGELLLERHQALEILRQSNAPRILHA